MLRFVDVLQYVEMCSGVLQCVAVCCSVLPCVIVHCSMLYLGLDAFGQCAQVC